MSEAILVLNAGSSSIKFALYARDESDLALRFKGDLDGIGTRPHLQGTNHPLATVLRLRPEHRSC